MTMMIPRCFKSGLAGVALFAAGMFAGGAGAVPDFKEVQQVIRERLTGATDEGVNRAAVDGLLAELKGRASLVPANGAAETNTGPLVSRQNAFDGNVGYVRVGRVAAGLGAEVATAVKEVSVSNKLTGLVLDLRFADGNDYAAAAGVVDLFLKAEAPLLNAGKGLINSTEKTNAIRVPVVALMNGETAAGAEALAAMLRQTGVGLLLGSRTAGRAGVTEDFKLSTGQTLRVVTAPVQLGDAKPVPATGVIPDIEVVVKPGDEKAYLADPFAVVGENKLEEHAQDRNTNSTAAAKPAKRVRVTEADLVREKRGDGDFETVTNARVKLEPETPVVQDPALSRAIDLLKGLAVVRRGKF
jgi:hypothetical protein